MYEKVPKKPVHKKPVDEKPKPVHNKPVHEKQQCVCIQYACMRYKGIVECTIHDSWEGRIPKMPPQIAEFPLR